MIELDERYKALHAALGLSEAEHAAAVLRMRSLFQARSSLACNGPARNQFDNPTHISRHETEAFNKALERIYADRECFMLEPPEGITMEFLIREGIPSERLSTFFLRNISTEDIKLPINRLIDLDTLIRFHRTKQTSSLDLGHLFELINIVAAVQTAGFIPGPPCVQMEMKSEARAIMKRAGLSDDHIRALEEDPAIARAARVLSAGKLRTSKP